MTENAAVLDDSVPHERGLIERTMSSSEQCARESRRQRDVRALCGPMMPHLNFRMDFTLRPWTVTTDDQGNTTRRKLTIDMIFRYTVRFMNRLNSDLLKVSRKVSAPPKIDAFIVLEFAGINRHPHLHGLAECPPHVAPVDFTAAVNRAWDAQKAVAARERYVQPVRDLAKSISYNLKSDDYYIAYHWHEPDETAFWRR